MRKPIEERKGEIPSLVRSRKVGMLYRVHTSRQEIAVKNFYYGIILGINYIFCRSIIQKPTSPFQKN